MEIGINLTVFFLFVFQWCEMRYNYYRKERKLKAFGSKLLRKLCGPERMKYYSMWGVTQ
jgi:hypothetical protein